MNETYKPKEALSVWPKIILKAQPLGFCAGVVRSVDAYQKLIDSNTERTIYSVGEPAHNENVNRNFRNQNVKFVNSIKDVPLDGIAALGPHGTKIEELEYAKRHRITTVDTECPLVRKVANEIDELLKQNFTIIYFGKKGHQETKAILSHDSQGGKIILVENIEDLEKIEVEDPKKVAFNSQTTHAASKVIEMQKKAQEKWPDIRTPKISDVCYATQNRQDALKMVIKRGAKIVVILGSETSSNGKELKTIALNAGVKTLYVNDASELTKDSFRGFNSVGLSAAASVSPEDISGVEDFFSENFNAEIINVTVADESKIRFAEPLVQNL